MVKKVKNVKSLVLTAYSEGSKENRDGGQNSDEAGEEGLGTTADSGVGGALSGEVDLVTGAPAAN